jgi:hypothetical protein
LSVPPAGGGVTGRGLAATQLERGRQVILMQPFELPGVRTPGYAQWMAACAAATQRIGERLQIPVIEIRCDDFTEDGLLPSDTGYRDIARQLADVALSGLVHGGSPGIPDMRIVCPYNAL